MKESQDTMKNTYFVRFELFPKVDFRTLKFCGKDL